MATINIVIRKDRPNKKTGLFKIEVRVTQNGKHDHFPTGRYAHPSELDKNLDFKKSDQLNNAVETLSYYKKLKPLGSRRYQMSAKEISVFLQIADDEPREPVFIDLIAETIAHANTLTKNYCNSFLTSINAFKDMTRQQRFDVNHLTSDVLRKFEDHIKKPKTIIRNDIKGRPREFAKKGAGNTTVCIYITNLQTVFNMLKTRYNGEKADEKAIPHDPFSKYKFPKKEIPKKRNLKPQIILDIRDYPHKIYMGTHGTNRVSLAKDVFMLSFYLAGMNAVDLYNVKTLKNGRLEYNRTKTKSRRKDEAFASIKLEPEAKAIMQKYMDPTKERVFIFHRMYVDSQSFVKNLNKGLRKLVKLCDPGSNLLDYEDLSTYYARHSWATIARNLCNIPKGDVAEALNHASEHDITDLYIERDWSLIDESNRKVLDVLLQTDTAALQENYEMEIIAEAS